MLCNVYWRCEGHYARVLAGLGRYYATRTGIGAVEERLGRHYATRIGAVEDGLDGIMQRVLALWRILDGIMQRVLALWRSALDGIMQRVLALWRAAWNRCGGAAWTALCNAY